MNLTELQTKTNEAISKMDLYDIAGELNNRPEHVHADKVTFMAFLDMSEARQYVLKMIEHSLKGAK